MSNESRPSFPVVGIGASAGGLAALQAFFSAVPHESHGVAFVVVQHLAPDHKSILADFVARCTPMRVRQVEDGMIVEPENVYIIPPNRQMVLVDGTLRLSDPEGRHGPRVPIDHFFRSLARDRGTDAVCVVLSGTGSDGTLGVRAIKEEGGMAMAQQPASADYDAMPRSAMDTGLVDFVLEPREMPTKLIAYLGNRSQCVRPPVPVAEETIRAVCAQLRAHTGHDFSQYKQNTVVRRVERRIALHQLTSWADYLELVKRDPKELDALFQDMLIGVTSFFRDPDAFEYLGTQVLPGILAGKGDNDLVRIWVCGCSTGEEAYSLAILVHEILETSRRKPKIQIFATDIDSTAVDRARTGIYAASIAADMSAERLASCFVRDADTGDYVVHRSIRDMIVFSEQDVTKDPPFSKLDLISCRNVLIYMNAELQKRLIPLFHYALRSGGILFLGASETVGDMSALFDALDRKWKVYARRDAAGRAHVAFGEFVTLPAGVSATHAPPEAPAEPRVTLREITLQALLQHFEACGVLVNARGGILHIYGRTGKYLEPAPGDADLNVIDMAREGLKRDLTTALHRAVSRHEPVRFEGLCVKSNGDHTVANLTVRPVITPGSTPADAYVIVLEEVATTNPSPHEAGTDEGDSGRDLRILELEQELVAKEEYLQTTLEEMETSNEELKSANEEMQSVNEELQSTNEELETSKEELQSVNEELSTVNAELQAKVVELSRANNDMNNLLAGTGVGTVFVDHALRVTRYTPTATQVINFIPTDLGRPLGHIVSNLRGYDRLVEDVQEVLDTLATKETEVRTKSGAWYLMRIRPYRTLDNVIEGAVVTFVDISRRKDIEQALWDSETRFSKAFQAIPVPLTLSRMDDRFVAANDEFLRAFDYSAEDVVGRKPSELGLAEVGRLVRGPEEDRVIHSRSGAPLCMLIPVVEFESQGQEVVLAFAVSMPSEHPTDSATTVKNATVSVFAQDRELRYTWFVNPQLGTSEESMVGKTDDDLFAPDEAARVRLLKQQVLDSGTSAHLRVSVVLSGHQGWYDLHVAAARDQGGVVGITGVLIRAK